MPNLAFAQTSLVVNEISVHPSDGEKEWVEFYNPSGIDLKTYWIDDDTDFASDSGGSAKKQMDTVFKGADDKHFVFDMPSAMFNNSGDVVVLFDNTGQIVDQFQYNEDPGIDRTFGRSPEGTGSFQMLANATKGSTNSGPLPTVTPTPLPTEKPTAEPTITRTPTQPKAKPTPTDIPITASSIQSTLGTKTTLESSKLKSKTATNGAYPTSILGISTKSAEKTPTPKPTKEVLVKGSKNSPISGIFMCIGGVFVLACGILIYLKRRNLGS
jgi:hypothetical protein